MHCPTSIRNAYRRTCLCKKVCDNNSYLILLFDLHYLNLDLSPYAKASSSSPIACLWVQSSSWEIKVSSTWEIKSFPLTTSTNNWEKIILDVTIFTNHFISVIISNNDPTLPVAGLDQVCMWWWPGVDQVCWWEARGIWTDLHHFFTPVFTHNTSRPPRTKQTAEIHRVQIKMEKFLSI